MKNSRINLLVPHLSGREKYYVERAFNNNRLASYGTNTDELSKRLENYLGESSRVTLLNSGTSAIHMALNVLGVTKDDEVICPSFTFCASVNPVLYNGAKPVFVDCEDTTWNISPFYLEKAIKDRIAKGKKPKAIIVVDIYGVPAKWNEISRIARAYEIPIIEDAAEAVGSEYENKKCGTFGDISIFSFNSNKLMTTSGGGALISMNEKYTRGAKFLATQAKEDATYYLHKELGFNYAMSNVTAGIGIAQFEVLDQRLEEKRNVHLFYKAFFESLKEYELFNVKEEKYKSNHWLNCILINKERTGFTNTELKSFLEKNNIETRCLWYPLHMQPLYKDTPFYGENIAHSLFEKGLSLPSSSSLTKKDLNTIVFELESMIR